MSRRCDRRPGNVFPESPDDASTAEIALLVKDAHQGTGVGEQEVP